MPANIDLQRVAMYVLAFVIAITIHEFGHAIAADRLGDDTPRRQGRISINPIDHLDFMGTIVFVLLVLYGWGFGWGKPVQIDPRRFRNPRTGDAIVSFAGPLTNLIQAGLLAWIIRAGSFNLPLDSPYRSLIEVAFELNVMLFVFNLVPIPPLDGSHILAAILPPTMADSYRKSMAMFGWVIFFAFLFLGLPLISPEITRIEDILLNACILL